MVIVDSSVWIQYLRRPASPDGGELEALLKRGEVILTGVVLAELLQGMRSARQLETLGSLLAELPYVEATKDTWIAAASFMRALREGGRSPQLPDMLIAAQAVAHRLTVYSLDADFSHVPGLSLHEAAAQ